MLGLSLLLLAFSNISFPRILGQHTCLWFLGALFAGYLLGLLYSAQVNSGIWFTYRQSPLLVLPFILLVNHNLVKWYGALYLKWFIWGTCFACLVTLGLFFLPHNTLLKIAPQLPSWGLLQFPEGVSLEKFGFYSPYIDRLSFSYLIGVAVLGSCWLWLSQNANPWFTLLLLCLLLTTAVVLGGRGGQLGLLAGLLVWGAYGAYALMVKLILVRTKGVKIAIVLALPVLGAFLAYGIFETVPSVWERYNQLFWELSMLHNGTFKDYDYLHFTSFRRILSWQNSWELIKQNPIFGVGTGDYRYEMQMLYDRQGLGFPVNAHNQFLQIWATLGLVGIFIFVGLFYALWHLLRSKANRPLRIFGKSVLLFYVVIFTLDGPLNAQVGVMSFALFMGFLSLQCHRYSGKKR